MNNYQSITASPEALAAFLGSIPAIETPWDGAFHSNRARRMTKAANTTAKLPRPSFTSTSVLGDPLTRTAPRLRPPPPSGIEHAA